MLSHAVLESLILGDLQYGCQEDQKLLFLPKKSPKDSRSGELNVGVNSLTKAMSPKEAKLVTNILHSVSRAQGKCRHKML